MLYYLFRKYQGGTDMKINTNIENRPIENRPAAGRTQHAAEITTTDSKTGSIHEKASQIAENISKKRTHFDAIVITQIAQSFFQKALLVSSSLGKVVSDALTSGEIKQGELTAALSGIRSSMSEIQGGITPNASNPPQNFAALFQYTGVQPHIPQIDTEVNELDKIINGMSSGTMPDLKTVDRITNSLTNKTSAIDNALSGFFSNLQFTATGLNAGLSAENSTAIVKSTETLISSYPLPALQAQGNINLEAVKNLI
jgi:hypothetical protein